MKKATAVTKEPDSKMLSFKDRMDICEILIGGKRCGFIVGTPRQTKMQFNITLAFECPVSDRDPYGWEWRTFEVVHDSVHESKMWLTSKWTALTGPFAPHKLFPLTHLNAMIPPFEKQSVSVSSVH